MTTFYDYRKKLRSQNVKTAMDVTPFDGHKDCKARDPDNCRQCGTGKYSKEGKEEAKEQKSEAAKSEEAKKDGENAAQKTDSKNAAEGEKKSDKGATEAIKDALKKSDGGAVVVTEAKGEEGKKDATPAVAAVVKKDDGETKGDAVKEAKGDCAASSPAVPGDPAEKNVFKNNPAAAKQYTFTAEDVKSVAETIKNDADIVAKFEDAVGEDFESDSYLREQAVKKAVYWCFFDNPDCYTETANEDKITLKASNGSLINVGQFLADVQSSVAEAAKECLAMRI